MGVVLGIYSHRDRNGSFPARRPKARVTQWTEGG